MLQSLLKPGNFDILMSCALNIAGYEENDGSSPKKIVSSPATAVACGYELKKAAIIIRCQALREKDINTKVNNVKTRLIFKQSKGKSKCRFKALFANMSQFPHSWHDSAPKQLTTWTTRIAKNGEKIHVDS